MNQLKKILFLLSVSYMNVLSADAIEFSYGTERFAEKARPYRYHSITFSETPSYAVKATDCGQGDGLSTYWDYMLFNDIVIKRVNCNNNKPGFRRLSDVGHGYTYDFYDASRTGNFLIPGLGSRRYSNDDGIYIGFTRVGRPVTSIGFIWGSVSNTIRVLHSTMV